MYRYDLLGYHAYIDDPSGISQFARNAMGITKPLPKKLLDALKYLQEDKAMVRVLGERFIELYLSVKQVCTFTVLLLN